MINKHLDTILRSIFAVLLLSLVSVSFSYAQEEEASESSEYLTELELDSTRPTADDLNRISELAEKFLAGTITEEERVELEASGTSIEMLQNQQRPSSVGTEANQAPMVIVDSVSTHEVNSLRTMLYGLAATNALLVVLFSMYIWRRRHIEPIDNMTE